MRIIVAMAPSGIIGVNGALPWHYKADFKRFKRLTMDGTVIVGRKTWLTIPKGLPGRRVLVISSSWPLADSNPDCEVYPNLDITMLAAGSDQHGGNGEVWVAGGESVYRAVLEQYSGDVEGVDVTIVPEVEIQPGDNLTLFPTDLLELRFTLDREERNEDDPRLLHRYYLPKH